MVMPPPEEGLRLLEADTDDEEWPDDGREPDETLTDSDLESLRDEFVDAFNARDLEALLALVRDDVDVPDLSGDGAPALAEELESIWERSPGAILTRGFLDTTPCAVAWLPDEEGCWSRAALVCFDTDDGLLNLVCMPDDPDGLDRAQAEEPTGEELPEWSDWAGWDRGEETVPRERS